VTLLDNIFTTKMFKRILLTVMTHYAGISTNEEDISRIPNSIEEIERVLRNAGYITVLDIAVAVYLSFIEYKPLLAEGPPGSGKTFLAKKIAEALNMPLIRFQCFEGRTKEDLIGHWDYNAQLLAIQRGGSEEGIYNLKFFEKGDLLKAILPDKRPDKSTIKQKVLLFDEFDKSDEEFEYMLLEYLGERQVSIPHLGTISEEKAGTKVYVFLSSNARRNFSEPFLRRCIYIYIDYPDIDTEMKIIKANVQNAETKLLIYIAELMNILRQENLEKAPTPAEAIELTEAMIKLNYKELTKENLEKLLPLIIKTRPDLEYISKKIDEIINRVKNKFEARTIELQEREKTKKPKIEQAKTEQPIISQKKEREKTTIRKEGATVEEEKQEPISEIEKLHKKIKS